MKKILSIMLAVLLISGVAFAATPGRDLGHGIGEVPKNGGYDWSPHKTFRLVRFEPASGGVDSRPLSADSLVIWDSNSDDGITVTSTTTSGDARVAGIIVQNALTNNPLGTSAKADYGKRNWTWLQTYGLSQADFYTGDAVLTVGTLFGTSGSIGQGTGFNYGISTAGQPCGFVFDAVAAGGAGNVEVFVRCE